MNYLYTCGFTQFGRCLPSNPAIKFFAASHAIFSRASGPLQQEVRHFLTVSEVSVVEEQKDAQLVINLIGEDIQRRVLSVGSTGKVEEYEVHYGATYAVEHGGSGESLIPKETIGQQRSYSFNQADVLAKDVEQERLVQDMRRDVVRQMMLRLQSVLNSSP